jgi:hypothetical protein
LFRLFESPFEEGERAALPLFFGVLLGEGSALMVGELLGE